MAATKPILRKLQMLERACGDQHLIGGHLKILGCVVRRMDQDLKAWPSIKTIARDAGLSTSTVKSGLAHLREHGYLLWTTGGPKKSNLYRLGSLPVWTSDTDQPRPTDRPGVGRQTGHQMADTPAPNMVKEPDYREGEKADPPPPPFQEILDLFNQLCPALPEALKITQKREQAITSLWRAELPDLTYWRDYFAAVQDSALLTGKAPPRPGYSTPWRADLDFLLRQETVVSMAEGKYDNRHEPRPPSQRYLNE